jgi:hypothetical protein
MASRIAAYRKKVALGEYELSGHAKDEMEQDEFTIEDVKAGIYSTIQRHDRGRRKDVVHGSGTNGRRIGLVRRLTESRTLRIITVFEL